MKYIAFILGILLAWWVIFKISVDIPENIKAIQNTIEVINQDLEIIHNDLDSINQTKIP